MTVPVILNKSIECGKLTIFLVALFEDQTFRLYTEIIRGFRLFLKHLYGDHSLKEKTLTSSIRVNINVTQTELRRVSLPPTPSPVNADPFKATGSRLN